MLRLLGEVGACVDGVRVDLGHPKQLCVLAALGVERGRVVPVERLVERVWGRTAPRRGLETVYSYLSRLRRALDPIEGVAIVRRPGGYALTADTAPAVVDLYRFQDLRAQAGADTDDERVAARLSEALALWGGRPLTGPAGEWVDAERERLENERLVAQLELTETRLRLGQGSRLVAELADLAVAHPYDEQIARHYMAALHQAGRTSDALAHYREIRARLAEELGIDPAAPLEHLHRQILAADPSAAATASAPPVPRQLPPAIRDFTGRAGHLAALDALLPPTGRNGGPAVVIAALDGPGGIGKTALAVHWAHRVRHRFPDGTLYADLRGYGPGRPASTDDVLDGFLAALGVPAPAGSGAREGLFRSLLAGRRMLLVLDDAGSEEQVRPLLPGTPGCMVLTTSRDLLTGLVVTEAAHRLTVGPLTPPEALRLVTGIIGAARAAAERDAVAELIARCARWPLALRIAAGRAAAHEHATVDGIVAELADDRSRLDALSWGRDPRAAVRTVLGGSYDRLPPRQRLLFRRLGLHPGSDVSPPTAAALVGFSPRETHVLLHSLADAHLIEPVAGGRYRFHDLLRAYAAEQAREHDDPGHRRPAVGAPCSNAADRRPRPAGTRLAAALRRAVAGDGDALAGHLADFLVLLGAREDAEALRHVEDAFVLDRGFDPDRRERASVPPPPASGTTGDEPGTPAGVPR
ncbi:AfsR/SARP family transcriptional regulator [Amycolatopsis tolypomycina]|uniref:DNA-binding transcriptional activator of the SARP family n=1 Tax=Amycolatopsis tolypomycina TaxID=208445 RepID=A0A1H4YKH9_9PSEU|nr:AfsR/SARP family transcriptional regulator [Amycolatopsis tolypomycina]SED17674.1 DNA-binding transcriptional activator of the SARP family [Amycolatopsis tolypomycina]